MGDVVDLSVVRKEKSDDARDWSVVDSLKEAIRKIEAGEWTPTASVFTAIENTPEGGRLLWSTAGVTQLEMIGLLVRHVVYHTSGGE